MLGEAFQRWGLWGPVDGEALLEEGFGATW